MRKPVIVGNWKMNKTPSEARALLEEVKALDLDENVEKGFYGLQFHPEAELTEEGHEILNNFIKICKRFKKNEL